MSLVRRKLRSKRVPEGFDRIEDVLNDFETQLRDAVNEEHEGKRRAELTWKVHRLHWEKNRFIHDLMYVKKAMSRELFDFLVVNKVADGPLIAKWRKPGYELLCSTLAIQRSGTAFGTTALCRVPLRQRAPQQREQPSVLTGCVSCASGDGRFGGPVWWNTPPAEEEGAGGGGAGAGGSGAGAAAAAAAAAAQHRATWAPVVPVDEEQAWGQERQQQAEAGAGEEEGGDRGDGGGGGSEGAAPAADAAGPPRPPADDDDDDREEGGKDEEEAAATTTAAVRKRPYGDERGPGAEDEEGAPPAQRGRGDGGDEDGGGGGSADDDDDDDDEEMNDEVRARLAALRGQG